MAPASRILGDEVGSTAPAFLAFLAVHVLGGLTAVITGAIAALVRKGSPRHIRAGRWYYRAVTVVSATAAVLAAAIAAPLIARAIRRPRPGVARDGQPGP